GDLLDLDRRSQFDLVAGDGRSTGVPGDVGVDLELAHHPGQGIDQFLVGLGAGLGGAARFEHGRGGQLVVTVHDTGGQGQLFGGGGRWGRSGCVGLLAGLLLRLGRLYGHLCLFFLVGEGGGQRFVEDRAVVGAFVVTRDRFGPGRLLPTLAGFVLLVRSEDADPGVGARVPVQEAGEEGLERVGGTGGRGRGDAREADDQAGGRE